MLVDNLLRLISGESLESALIEPRLVVRKSCGSQAAAR
jgi:DNA-binding LacI/PurR family transcriptional regulator